MNSEPVITAMRIEDFDAIIVLWQSTEGVGLNESDTRESIAAFLERNPDLSLVARNEHGNIIAAMLCGHDGRRGYLHHLAVARQYRRHGLGRRLVETALSKLAELGVQKCNIYLYADNADGRVFWEKHGWKERADLRVLQKPTR